MSTIIMSQCWPLQMGRTEKSVLISLADNANDQGVCWPAVDTIAMRCCLSDRAVQKAMDWLEAHGLISRQRKTGRSTVYTVTPGNYEPPAKAEKKQPPNAVHPRSAFTPEGGSPLNGVHPTPEAGSPPPPNGVHQPPNAVHPNRKEPTAEPKGNRQGATAKKSKVEKPATGFDALWAIYPRKVAKADAEKAFRKLAPDAALLEVLLAAATAQSAWPKWRENGGEFVPHLATWLNGKRWEDQPPAAPAEAAGQAGGDDGGWWQSATGIEAKGVECWRARKAGEEFQRYKVGVFKAAGDGPWRAALLADLLRTKNQSHAAVHEYFYGHPPIEGQA